jgi:hypothetical protein
MPTVYGNPGVWGDVAGVNYGYGTYRKGGTGPLTYKATRRKGKGGGGGGGGGGVGGTDYVSRILRRYYDSIFMTPQQQRALARKDTNLAIQDSMRDLERTRQRQYEQMKREQYAQSSYAGLLRDYGAPGSPEAQQIRDAYARAAGLNQRTAEGFISSTTGQQAANAAEGQATSANLAGEAGAMPSSGQNADVLNYLASLPAGTFLAQGEAGAAALGSAAANAGGQFATRAAAVEGDLQELSDKYGVAVQDLLAKRPAMVADYLAKLRGDEAQSMGALGSLLALQGNQVSDAFGVTLDQAKLNADIAASKAKNDLERKKIRNKALFDQGLNPDGKTPRPGFYIAPNGTVQKVPYGSKVNAQGKLVKDPNIPGGSKAGTAGAAPKRNDYDEARKNMLERAQARWGLDKPRITKIPVPSLAAIEQFVFNNAAKDFILAFPGQKQWARSAAKQTAIAIRNQIITANKGL